MGIQKVGVIGAGNMGSGIAQKIAQEGIEVIMIDTEDSFVQKGMDNIFNTLKEAVERRIFNEHQVEEILNRVRGTTDLEAVRDADLVIEVVFEDIDVKKDLFRKLDNLCEPKTVLASNTSSFSITELASVVNRKDRFLGLHFFYHPAKNRLLEVIPGAETSPETVELGNTFSRLIGKTAINVKDATGFAVNRFFVPWLNEATKLLCENVANIPTIDAVAKTVFKIGMGPFELMNATGIPIAYHSTVNLGAEVSAVYGPSDCLKRQFESGEPWDLGGDVDDSKTEEIEARLLGTVFMVACKLVEKEVASIEDTDRGAKIGLRWRLGPFEMMNKYGIERSYGFVKSYVERYPVKMPGILSQQYERKENWHISYVDLEIKGDIATITFNRPEVMNAINEEVMHQLDEQFTRAGNDPNVKTIVLEGAGKAFVAGAEIDYFIKKIDTNKISDIVEFTKYGHSVLQKIDNSEKLVIVKLDGLALGGGAEIALAADMIMATDKATLGFPETGIGIYPGLGGTQRTTKYIGKELAKYLILTGRTIDARTAADIGLVEYVVKPEELESRINNLTNCGGVNELGQKLSKTVSFKAPLAIKLANTLIDEGSVVNLEEGLKMELEHLTEIFSTKDAHEGLTSVLERRRPVFTGE
jgi:enoyl-CoA hydratase/3-hydroxyacyl-CoA dehydrogenase